MLTKPCRRQWLERPAVCCWILLMELLQLVWLALEVVCPGCLYLDLSGERRLSQRTMCSLYQCCCPYNMQLVPVLLPLQYAACTSVIALTLCQPAAGCSAIELAIVGWPWVRGYTEASVRCPVWQLMMYGTAIRSR